MINNNWKYNLTIITLLIFITELATDIYVPSLPRIASAFNTSEYKVMLTVSINLIGLSLSGLLYGPLSDAIGRKTVLLFGITIFCFSSLFCIYVSTIELIVFWRLLQGIGGGASVTVGLATISDIYKGNERAKMMSRLNMVVAFSPALGPIIGSQIAAYDNRWYLPLAIIPSLAFPVLLLLITLFKETLTQTNIGINFNNIKASFKEVLSNKNFICYLLIQSLTFGWLWADIVNLPFIFIKDMNVPTEHYGYYIIANVTVYIIGVVANQKLVQFKGPEKMILYGIVLILFSGISLTFSAIYFTLTAYIVLLLKLPAAIGVGFTLGNASALSLMQITNYGTASAIIGSTEMLLGSLGIKIISYLYNGTILPLSILVVVFSLISLLIFQKIKSSTNLTTKRETVYKHQNRIM